MTRGRGAFLALLAAGAFGASSPILKRFLGDVPPLALSGLLYLGAGAAATLAAVARASPAEARLRGGDFAWLAAGIASGGVLAPALLLVGLARTTATSASLLLNAELPLTVLVAAVVFREAVGRRVALATLLVAAGGAALALEPAHAGAAAPGRGALLVAGACVAWALENNLTRRIADRDPFAIVRWKGLAGGITSLSLAAATGTLALPDAGRFGLALLVGGVSYGASIVLYTYAQRELGAARTAALYGLGPFLGAALALGLGDAPSAPTALGAVAMAGGAWLLLTERHVHRHVHGAFVHEHRHVHDEHHRHAHDGSEGPEPHTHPHVHEPLEHEHEHAPDLHHGHGHEDRGG